MPAIRTRTGSANSPPNRQYDERMRARAAIMVSLLGIVALAGCTPDPGRRLRRAATWSSGPSFAQGFALF